MLPLELLAETLERRQMLAGNVIARVTGAGDLIILGNAQDNDITIVSGESSDQIVVIGNGTTVNRDSDFFVADGVTRNIRIRLRGGNDTVNIGSDLSGIGELPVSVASLQFDGKLDAHMGGGHDHFLLQGNDPFAPVQLTGELFVRMGSGHDNFVVRGNSIAALDNEGPTGNSLQLGVIHVNGLAGNDYLAVEDVTMSGDLHIHDNWGHDVVSVAYIDMNGENCEVEVGTCGGQDEICFDGDFEGMDVGVHGGGGRDTLLGEANLPENARIRSMEERGYHPT